MHTEKKVLSCANRPTLQTSPPFEGHVAVAKDEPHIQFDRFAVIQEENRRYYSLSLMVSITAQLRVPSSSEVCTASRASLALCLFSLATR